MRRVRHPFSCSPWLTPFGAHAVPGGVSFTLVSRHATRVWLLLFDAPDAARPDREVELTAARNRIGDLWHVFVPGARAGQFYVYRVDGRLPDGTRGFFDPEQWLLDPYALAVAGAPRWGDRTGLRPGRPLKRGARFPKGVILADRFDWKDDRHPRTPLRDTVVYEAHVRGFTAHPSAGVRHPGTYRGLIEKIPYLRDLGVTAVELLPVQEFNEMEFFIENFNRKHLLNFWGYSPVAFFAPNGRYAASGVTGGQVREFRELVVALHRAGMEIILDVVFNHTAEGGDGGPTYSFRGIDNGLYYMMDESGRHYRNYSGCGNTFNSNHPVVRDLLLDCLRYWVLHLHVDGFRFDLASILTRGPDGAILPNPPLVEHIAEDPVLRDTKIIAEAWDAAGAYQVGHFPSERWSEWNGQFRDDMRGFWRGDSGMLRRFATRLCGSDDLYRRPGQSPQKSINFVTSHDGFTLRDLVSYTARRNQANGENSADGEPHNLSANYGHEGPTDDPAIQALRMRQQKNLLASLLLSQGVPMLLAGDEFSRTQQGNNNAYCQDNEVSWIDWNLLEQNRDLHVFARKLIAFRKAHPALRRTAFFRGESSADIAWLGPEGRPPDWEKGQAIGCLLSGRRASTGAERDDVDLLLLFNAGAKAIEFRLPGDSGRAWYWAWSTQEQEPQRGRDANWIWAEGRSTSVYSRDP